MKPFQPLFDLADRIKAIDTEEIFIKVFQNKDTQDYIIDLNLTNQLRFGILSDNRLMPNYSPTSVSKFGKPNEPISLYDEGIFYKSFRVVDLTNSGFTITANQIRDGEDILAQFEGYAELDDVTGLNDENMSLLIEHIKPIVKDIILSRMLG